MANLTLLANDPATANGGLVFAAALLVLLLVAQSGAQRPRAPSRAMHRLQPRFASLGDWPATLPITLRNWRLLGRASRDCRLTTEGWYTSFV